LRERRIGYNAEMKLRHLHRYSWFTVKFWFWRMPIAVWVLLASVQIVRFVLIELEVMESDSALAKGGAQGTLSAWASGMQAEQIWLLVVAAICLVLAKLTINRQRRATQE
jgi:hypothetical protein